MDFNDIKVYGKKNFADVLKEIHTAQKDKEKELKNLINELKPLISTAGDAILIVPLITKYMDVSIKNDDNLIKMAGIIQRAINAGKQSEDGNVQLSDEEKDQLLKNIEELKIV